MKIRTARGCKLRLCYFLSRSRRHHLTRTSDVSPNATEFPFDASILVEDGDKRNEQTSGADVIRSVGAGTGLNIAINFIQEYSHNLIGDLLRGIWAAIRTMSLVNGVEEPLFNPIIIPVQDNLGRAWYLQVVPTNRADLGPISFAELELIAQQLYTVLYGWGWDMTATFNIINTATYSPGDPVLASGVFTAGDPPDGVNG